MMLLSNQSTLLIINDDGHLSPKPIINSIKLCGRDNLINLCVILLFNRNIEQYFSHLKNSYLVISVPIPIYCVVDKYFTGAASIKRKKIPSLPSMIGLLHDNSSEEAAGNKSKKKNKSDTKCNKI